jgi:hypothetical protein
MDMACNSNIEGDENTEQKHYSYRRMDGRINTGLKEPGSVNVYKDLSVTKPAFLHSDT